MVARAIADDITVLGPNCLGFVNAQTRSAPYALSMQPPLLPGPVGVGLQSGALASVVLSFARLHAIGLTTLTSVGNESHDEDRRLHRLPGGGRGHQVICPVPGGDRGLQAGSPGWRRRRTGRVSRSSR